MSQDSLRRVIRIEEKAIVGALLPRHEGAEWLFMVKGPADAHYRHVAAWHTVMPGDEVVAYLLDGERLQDLQDLNALYSDTWYVGERWAEAQHPWDDELGVFGEWVPERDAFVLETCCGSGRTAPTLVRDGNRVVGVDLAAPSLVYAKERAPKGLSYVRGDVTALPFADGTFDVVLCLENSLGEFLVDPLKPLAEMVRVCKSGGKVIIALRDARDPGVSWSHEGFVHVVRCFPPERRTAFLEQASELPRVGPIWTWKGHERPWGGTVWHAALDIK